jgi:hypothetical protein
MQKTPENLKWAIGKLMELGYMAEFPQTEASILLTAKGFLNIVGDQPACYEDRNDDPARGPERVEIRPFIPVGVAVDKLMENLNERFQRFPKLIQQRAVWEELGYTPADGRSSAEIRVWVEKGD